MKKSIQHDEVSYYLSRIEVYNWGGFANFHQADIHPNGTAIIGQTGSGKTTLIDALMTLLTVRPSYNLASTGGHESDRDLISYIRGVSGAGENSEDISRAGKTRTAITAYFTPIDNKQNFKENLSQIEQETISHQQGLLHDDLFAEPSITQANALISQNSLSNSITQLPVVALGVIFWIDSTSNSPKDRNDVWLFSQDNSTLKDWLHEFDQGQKKGLKHWAKNREKLSIFDSKSSYLAKAQQFFEVGDNAFKLLNRTVGLKQLNSIDEIFRELVLDDHSLFDQAEAIVKQFDTLTQIRHDLETAKKQQKSLLPLMGLQATWQKLHQQAEQYQKIIDYLPFWYAFFAVGLWQQKIDNLKVTYKSVQYDVSQTQQQFEQLNQQYHVLLDRYNQTGGASLSLLQQQIAKQELVNNQLQKHWQHYLQLVQALQFEPATTPLQLTEQQATAKQKQQQLVVEVEQFEQQRDELGAEKQRLYQDWQDKQQQLRQALQQKSNIPPKFEQFRQDLASHLQCDSEQLPYLAQLVEVKPHEKHWQGAIERALGSHRLRLLVPDEAMPKALAWVNARHNQLHVRLYQANPQDVQQKPYFSDSFVHKLNLKNHSLSDALQAILSTLDRHCVANETLLQTTSHAMTEQGLMSNNRGWFDKQDQKSLNDDWLTGFDNQTLVKNLTQQQQQAKQAYEAVNQQYHQLKQQLDGLRQSAILLERLQQIDFDSINLAQVQAQLQQLQQSYAMLTAPDSELSQLKTQCDTLKTQLEQLQQQLNSQNVQLQLNERQQQDYQHRQQQSQQYLSKFTGKNLSEQPVFQQISAETLPLTLTDLDNIHYLEKENQRLWGQQQEANLKKISETERKIINQMNVAKQADTGSLTEVGTDMQDLPAYLERLTLLNEEDLPSQEKRFVQYLTDSSTESVSQLLSDMKGQIDQIKERILGLNRVLQEVDFDKAKYLQLNLHPVSHASVKEFEQADKRLKSFSLDIKNPNPEGHYSALRQLIGLLQTAIDKKNTLASRALLDTRYRLGFSISVLSRVDHSVLETRTGSQRGSGGEKEIIASYILTASLSYALDPSGFLTPKFSTIVLDEAFSKSSQAVAGRIVKAIHAFGLHPLFVTPNKEMRLLREHTQSAVLVHRKDKNATLSNWSWDKIEAEAQKQLATPKP
ncbi:MULTISPECIES: ATP-binding protein [unclassified Moraxella]|uniref:ATP-binding protein n=1 Tax=unclassified Moraxella TaxID=2685852 RepID=UPI003AF8E4AD